MGCDIHVWLERKIDDEWCMISEASSGCGGKFDSFGRERDYAFFAQLAGVRGDGPPPKGLPDDVSKVVQYHSDRWGYDGHSHSWNTLKEWMEIKVSLMRVRKDERVSKVEGNNYALWCYYLLGHEPIFDEDNVEEWIESFDDYRVVYFFDN